MNKIISYLDEIINELALKCQKEKDKKQEPQYIAELERQIQELNKIKMELQQQERDRHGK